MDARNKFFDEIAVAEDTNERQVIVDGKKQYHAVQMDKDSVNKNLPENSKHTPSPSKSYDEYKKV